MRQRLKPKNHIIIDAIASLAENVSQASPCNRAAVGCVLTTVDFQIISYGYNGPAANMPNECLRPQVVGNCGCVHAEQNAIAKISSNAGPKVAFITMPPCERCASLLVNAGVIFVVYLTDGHRPMSEGEVNILQPLGIPCLSMEKLSKSDIIYDLNRKMQSLK